MKFRTRSVRVDAEQWFPGAQIAGVRVTAVDSNFDYGSGAGNGLVELRTPQATVKVSPGDWIVTDRSGGKTRVTPGRFAELYEAEGS